MKFCACTIVLQCYVSVRDGNKATLPLIMVWCPALRKCTQPILNEKHRKLSISNSDLVLTASQIHESSPFFKLWWFFFKLHLTQWTIDQYTLATLNIVMIVTKILLWTSKQCVITAPYLWIKVNKNSLASKSSQKKQNKTITANCYTLTINESQQSHFSLYFYDTVIIICRQRKEYIKFSQ